MNTTIMAERQAKAVQAIAEAVTRLGGTFTAPTGRVPNPATKHVLYLEALVEALDGIGVQPLFEPSAPVAETQPVEDVQPSLLYTSDTADDMQCVNLPDARIITQKSYTTNKQT